MLSRAHSLSPWFPILVLLGALIPLGAGSPLARTSVFLLVSGGFLVQFAVLCARAGTGIATDVVLSKTHPLMLIALPVFVAMQLATQLILDNASGPIFAVAESTVSLIVYALFYLLVRGAASEPRNVRILLAGLSGLGAIEALYGLLNLLGGNDTLLVWERWIFFDSATGTLSSRNHFAYLMELLLPASAAFAILFGRTGPQVRSRTVDPVERNARTLTVAAISTLCGLALIFSKSRLGILSFFVAGALILILNRSLEPATRDGQTERRMGWAIATCCLATGLVLTASIGLDSVLERFLSVENDFVSGRLPIWSAALAMFLDKPILGQGWGTFQALLPGYRSAPTGLFYTHAHNDYIEVLAEGGIVGLALTLLLVFCFARRLLHALETPLRTTQRTVILWLSIGLTSTLLHSFGDYGLRTPGVALTFVAMAAIFSRITEDPDLLNDQYQRRRRRTRLEETVARP